MSASELSTPGRTSLAGDKAATVLEVTQAFRQFAQTEEQKLDEFHARGISRQKLHPRDTQNQSCGNVSGVTLQLGWIGGDRFEVQVRDPPGVRRGLFWNCCKQMVKARLTPSGNVHMFSSSQHRAPRMFAAHIRITQVW